MFAKTGTTQSAEVLEESAFRGRIADKKIVEFDPSFCYIAVRALSADRPNSNGDCFPHEELTRIDTLNKRPVYASFLGKGLYVNHKADDPRTAKGIVLDARYVQDNPEDRYVELLIAVDKQKDPIFARDVERGLINKFSMGASVQYTKCSICNKEARKREDFCDHISKYKMKPCKTASGEEKLAYELCYGVQYNEISAVSDPADEKALLLAKVAENDPTKNNENSSHGTVVILNDIRSSLKNLEAVMKGTTTNKKATTKVAMPPAPPAGDPMGGPMDGPPVEEMGMEETGGDEQVAADALRVVSDYLEGNLAAAEAVAALEALKGGVPAEEEGLPPVESPVATSMMTPTAKLEAIVEKLAKEIGNRGKEMGNESVKTAEESGKPKGQYPDYSVQKDPKQHHSKPLKGRPSSDFDQSAKELSKLLNINAEFVGNEDRREAGWKVSDGETPLFMVTGGRTFAEYLDELWPKFASRAYGEDLVKAILEDGLDKTMVHVKALRFDDWESRTSERAVLEEKLTAAAEAKASDLAQELREDFIVRFVEGMKVALKLAAKNVAENPIKASAFEVLTRIGADGALAEEIVTAEAVEAQFESAMKEALKYSEMDPDAFEEVKAHVEMLPSTRVVEAYTSDEEQDEKIEAAARSVLRKTASLNIGAVRTGPGDTGFQGFGDRISLAVRSGLRQQHIPSGDRPTYAPRNR